MQDILVEKPYQFIPPHRGAWLPKFLLSPVGIHARLIRSIEGVVSHESRHAERLRQSIDAGHSILVAPNHCRTADPIALGWLCEDTPTLFYCMASWHLFNQGWLKAKVIRSMGAFSVNREGVDRQAINLAIELLVEAKRPMVIFPEGSTSRTNDKLQALLDGVAFIARSAAKKRAKAERPGKVVVHPVGIKYRLQCDLADCTEKTLAEIEHRLSWRPQGHLPLWDRVAKVGRALLALKEMEHLGQTGSGPMTERLRALMDHLLVPLEQAYFGEPRSGPTVPRVRNLRAQIMPEMVAGKLSANERSRRWRQLEDLYLAQQLSSYLPDYFSRPTVDRIFELVEKFEEDLTDKISRRPPLHCILDVGEAIEVNPERDRKATVDPLMAELEAQLQGLLDQLATESPLYEEPEARMESTQTEATKG
jgi:1-acyl-sn-glycerol-3-phosphate acyltransferase